MKMKKIFGSFLGVTISVLISNLAFAGWQVVYQFPGNGEVLNTDACSHRIRFLDTSNGLHKDHYYNVDKVLQFRNEQGEPYSQSFSAIVSKEIVGWLHFAGAFLSQNAYNQINALYTPETQPFDLKLTATINSSIEQISFSYNWWNNGQIYGTTYILDKDFFSIEAMCQTSTPPGSIVHQGNTQN